MNSGNLLPNDLAAQRPIFLLGATSIVGYNVVMRQAAGVTGIITSRSRNRALAHWPRLALHDPQALDDFCATLPNGAIIIYCDAVCDVSKCEETPAWAREINVGNLIRTMDALPSHARLVYVSSDHVFGSDGTYDESCAPCPVSAYGAIRVEAERLALRRPGTLLLRAGLPIGPSPDGKSGHLDWLRYRLGKGLPVTIVQDEARSAMPSVLLADRIVALARSTCTGIRHITAQRLISRVDLATALHNHYGLPGKLSFALRHDQPAPHLGRIHLATHHSDSLATPLPCPIELLKTSPHLLTSHNSPSHIINDERSKSTRIGSHA